MVMWTHGSYGPRSATVSHWSTAMSCYHPQLSITLAKSWLRSGAPGLELAPVWDGGIANSFIYYVTMPAMHEWIFKSLQRLYIGVERVIW